MMTGVRSYMYYMTACIRSPMYFSAEVCVYKGNMYQQGQKWQDGCDYNCECIEAMTGHYRCTEM